MSGPDLIASLRDVVDPAILSDDPGDRRAHAHDWTPRALLAARRGQIRDWVAGVARPRRTEEVAELLGWAQESRTPVVCFGGGSGVCAAIGDPGSPALVMDMSAMARVIDVDTKSRLVQVESGVTGPQLTEKLAAEGWMTGHEPQSIAVSTVGGWIATRACGQLSARYGGIEDLLAGLEAVLPGGQVVRSKTVPRRSTGPDVASLMVGSEGCLGVVTEATLRITPRPQERVDRCVRFEHMSDGVAACRRIIQAGLAPTLVRLYDPEDAALFLRKHPGEATGPLLLLSFDGRGAGERADEAASGDGTPGNDELVAHWWTHRNDAVKEYRRVMMGEGVLGPHGVVDTMEVAGSWTILRDLYHRMKEALSAEADLVGCHLSHVYPDGACLYFTIASATADDDAAAARLDSWWATGMGTCMAAGGSISHHHGIGRLKADWLDRELIGWLEVLRALKTAVDPHGIMNPGVLGL